MRKNMKLQSAMEYLMTYGWAILIIAVVMVALFALGVFNGHTTTSCVAISGYLCQSPIWSHTTDGLSVTIGQTTGTNWASANIFYVPQGTSSLNGIPALIPSTGGGTLYYNGNQINGGLISGQTYSANIPIVAVASSPPTTSAGLLTPDTAGTSTNGALWAAYTTSGGSTEYFVQIATVSLVSV